MITGSGVYRNGRRIAKPMSIDGILEACQTSDEMAWTDLVDPDEAELEALTEGLKSTALVGRSESGPLRHPRLERHGAATLIVLHVAHFDGRRDREELDEFLLYFSRRFVTTIRRGPAPDLTTVRERLERDEIRLRQGTGAVIVSILGHLIDEYARITERLGSDVEQIESQLFVTEGDPVRRIYDESRALIEFQQAVDPIPSILADLRTFNLIGGDHRVSPVSLENMEDHAGRLVRQVGIYRDLVQNLISVTLSIVQQRQTTSVRSLIDAMKEQNGAIQLLIQTTQRQSEEVSKISAWSAIEEQQNAEFQALTQALLEQNDETARLGETTLQQSEEVKKISAWAAILFAPTLIGTVYGMNFEHMPELGWTWGYPLALAMMLLTGVVLYAVFRMRGWLSSQPAVSVRRPDDGVAGKRLR